MDFKFRLREWNPLLMFMIVDGSKVLRGIAKIQPVMKHEDLFLSFGSIATLPLTARDTSPTHPRIPALDAKMHPATAPQPESRSFATAAPHSRLSQPQNCTASRGTPVLLRVRSTGGTSSARVLVPEPLWPSHSRNSPRGPRRPSDSPSEN